MPIYGFKLSAEFWTLPASIVDCATLCTLKPERQRPSGFGVGTKQNKQILKKILLFNSSKDDYFELFPPKM